MRLGAGRSASGSFNDQVGAEQQRLRYMQAGGVGCSGIDRKDENGAIAKKAAQSTPQWDDTLFANAAKM
jgi:hypothetical protein